MSMRQFTQTSTTTSLRTFHNLYQVLALVLLVASATLVSAQRTDRLDLVVRRARFIPDMQHAAISVCVRNIETDSTIYASDANHALPPASLNKLITAAVAYNQLGPDYRFQTTFEYSGYIDVSRKTLHGDIFLRGNGDPLMGSPRFKQVLSDSLFYDIMKLIQFEGINRISGKIYVDATAYRDESVHPTWQWGDIGNGWGTGASAVNYHDNIVSIHISAGNNIGDSAKILSVNPDIPIINELVTCAQDSISGINCYGSPCDAGRICRGSIPLGINDTVVYASLPTPGLVMGRDLTHFLRRHGISINGAAALWDTRQRRPTTHPFANKYVSHNLRTILEHAIFTNYNTVAESIYKHIGLALVHDGGFAGGSNAIHRYFQQIGLDDDNIHIVDGSGLSQENQITADFLCRFLDTLATARYFDDMFESWKNPTDKESSAFLMPRVPHRCVLKYKTGIGKGVQNVTGYFINRKGTVYSFAILCNNNGDSAMPTSVLTSIMEEIMRL